MGRYIYAPANTNNWYGSRIYRCVEFIGSTQKGRGNKIAKGRRYLKKKVGCSGNAIRRAVRTEERSYKHDYQQYGLDVYYYHKDYANIILQEIIDFVRENACADKIEELFDCVPNDDQYLQLIYWHQLRRLDWVAVMDYKKQGDSARILCDKFSEIK